jgi:hypothetical protein
MRNLFFLMVLMILLLQDSCCTRAYVQGFFLAIDLTGF